MIPDAVRTAVESRLTIDAARPVRIDSVRSAGGGCISPAAIIDTDQAGRHFLKWSERQAPQTFFAEEARSLRALGETGSIRVPQVEAFADDWILLEWLGPGRAGPDTWTRLGHQLAALHRQRADSFGWDSDNFIGTLHQSNARDTNWARFWAECRLIPQWRLCSGRHGLTADDGRRFDRLVGRLDDLSAPAAADGASLLHGDLWNGNVHITADGAAAVIDPSSYYGHREVDLAMARLFGGFGDGFFEAYGEVWPMRAGHEARRDLYQLYYLLVHVNLFGSGYVAGTRRVLQRYG